MRTTKCVITLFRYADKTHRNYTQFHLPNDVPLNPPCKDSASVVRRRGRPSRQVLFSSPPEVSRSRNKRHCQQQQQQEDPEESDEAIAAAALANLSLPPPLIHVDDDVLSDDDSDDEESVVSLRYRTTDQEDWSCVREGEEGRDVSPILYTRERELF